MLRTDTSGGLFCYSYKKWKAISIISITFTAKESTNHVTRSDYLLVAYLQLILNQIYIPLLEWKERRIVRTQRRK